MKPEDLNNDTELRERLRKGDHQAFRLIFEEHWLALYSYARRRIISEQETEELVQTVFLELWEKRERLVIQCLSSYLMVCVRNKCIDFIRSKARHDQYFEHFKMFAEHKLNTTEEAIEFEDLHEQMNEALRTLPEKSQLIFRMSKLEGFSVNEISERVNLSSKAVEYHLTKATKRLRVSLKEFSISRLLHLFILSLFF